MGPRDSPGSATLVKVAATSVNLSDWECLRGSPFYARTGGLRSPAHRTLGSDIAGWVEAVGAGVTRFACGDEVYGDNLTSVKAERSAKWWLSRTSNGQPA